MTCERTRLELDGKAVTVFVCTRDKAKPKAACVSCGAPADRLCDWKLKGSAEGRTCDRPLCRRCTTSPAVGKDLCPAHATAWAKHPQNAAREG